jgi:hypothetical protein
MLLCLLRRLWSVDRLLRFSFAASFLLFAMTAIWNAPSLAWAQDDGQETESSFSAPSEPETSIPKPPAAKPPIGVPAYAPPSAGYQPYVQPSFAAAPYGQSYSSPSVFGASPPSSLLQQPNPYAASATRSIKRDAEVGAMYDQRQFPVTPSQVFQQEPRPCGQLGCPHCRSANRTCAGTAIIADSPAPTIKLRPGEAAQVILELIDQVGPSVLDGTLYAQPPADADQPCLAKPKSVMQGSPRDALVQWIRRAEVERERQRAEAEVEIETPAPAPVQEQPVDVRQLSLVETLRTVGEQLDDAANLLERQSLFYRADQLRDLATQLRQESRSAQGGWSLQPLRSPSAERPPHPERDLKLEVEMLQQELRQALKALDRKSDESRR